VARIWAGRQVPEQNIFAPVAADANHEFATPAGSGSSSRRRDDDNGLLSKVDVFLRKFAIL
jgi:hypothetical protein